MSRSTLTRALVVFFLMSASFVAGFATHRSQAHEFLQPAAAYALRNTGGCGLSQSYTALPSYIGEPRRRIAASRSLLEIRDGLEHWKYDGGEIWTPPGTDWDFVLAEQRVGIYGNGQYRVRPDDVVLDAGANIGAFVREALAAGARTIVAIEPVPENVEALRRTFAAEIQQGRVIVYPQGVWNKDDFFEMTLYDNSALDSFVMRERREAPGETGRKVKLPLTTIDALVAELKLPRVDFIKMDIEGAERQALEGARATIKTFTPRMAVATENLPDDHVVLPAQIQAINPAYQWTCGHAVFTGPLTIRPAVLYFTH